MHSFNNKTLTKTDDLKDIFRVWHCWTVFFCPQKAQRSVSGIKIFEEKLEVHMNINKCTVFMHDGVACHCLKTVKQILQEKNWQHWIG